MRDIFDQDKSLSLGVVRQAGMVFSLLLAAMAVLALLRGLGRVFTGHVLGGLVETLGAFVGLGFLFLVVRLLTELLAAHHRLNDRLTVLGDDLRARRETQKDD
ncbi:MAG TPA: hypothetical protein PLR76_10900 [Hyphomonas sp.]|nr:hypothetical protein [Hyphomonas sp.]MCB9970791.1 hypothetical protein [Hyphomonas sp.]HPE48899.1 hypothetical protein [Hyphomonas sp.]